MKAPTQNLLVAVQWGDERAARTCEFIDRGGFRVTMPFDPKVGQPVTAWFREAGSRGGGFQVQGVVSSVCHAFEDDEGHRLVISYLPGTPAQEVDRVIAMGVRHGIADRNLLPKTVTRTPAPDGALGAVVHTPQLGRDGIGRGHLRGERRLWTLERLRPREVGMALGELLDGTFLLPNVQLAPDELDRVVLRVSLDGHGVLLPCEVRFQVEPGQGPPGVVLALGRVPVVLRSRLADAVTRGLRGGVAQGRAPAAEVSRGGSSPQRSPSRRLGKPRPSRARDRLRGEGSGSPAAEAPKRRVRSRRQTDPVVRISRAPLPSKTLSKGPMSAPPVTPTAPPVPGAPLPGTTLPPVRRAQAEGDPVAAPAASPRPASAQAPLAGEASQPAAAVRKPARRASGRSTPQPQAPMRSPEPTPAPSEVPPPGGHRHALAAAMLLGRTPAPSKAAKPRTPAGRAAHDTPPAGVLRRPRSTPSDD